MKSVLRTQARYLNVASRRWHMPSGKLTSTSADELAHFNALASSWWDVNGPQRILHKMNLLRMDFIYDTVRKYVQLNDPHTPEEDRIYIPPYSVDLLPEPIKRQIVLEQETRRDELLEQKKLTVLDVGCGGGILSESMARTSFVDSVNAIDLSPEVLEAARLHQQKDPMLMEAGKLTYHLSAIEDLPKDDKYDIITMFEVLEHVDYPARVMTEGLERLNVGGWMFISTINRDFVSWFTTIFMGEHVLRIVPVGTHTLEKYINQEEIREWITETPERRDCFEVVDVRGTVYLPAYGWKFTSNADVGNYFMAIRRTK